MKRAGMKKTIITLIVTVVVALYGYVDNSSTPSGKSLQQASGSADIILKNAYADRRSDIQVQGSGIVIRRLPDDLKGSRHQRFILKLASGQKLLVAHNIDLSKKITSLQEGDTVEFNGEYEYNAKGGVLHWTHHDPGNRHEDGWLRHKGRLYQ